MTEIVGEGKDRHAIVPKGRALLVGAESTEVEKIWMEENQQLREALSLARSIILSGEKMSPRAQAQIDAALQLIDGPGGSNGDL